MLKILDYIFIFCKTACGKPIDASQELIAIGTANILNSFVQGFPCTGALSRGAVNNASGVRTPLGNIYTGALVMVALLFLTPYLFFIPKSTLAAIIITAVVFMVETKVIKPMWRAKSKLSLKDVLTSFDDFRSRKRSCSGPLYLCVLPGSTIATRNSDWHWD